MCGQACSSCPWYHDLDQQRAVGRNGNAVSHENLPNFQADGQRQVGVDACATELFVGNHAYAEGSQFIAQLSLQCLRILCFQAHNSVFSAAMGLADRLANWLADCLADWLADRHADWLADDFAR